MKPDILASLADGLAASTKAYVAKAIEPLMQRIVELEAQRQLTAGRIAALETEAKMLRVELETRTSPGPWDATAKIYRARQ